MSDLTTQNHQRPQTLVYKLDVAGDNFKTKKVTAETGQRILDAMTPRTPTRTPRLTPREAKESSRNQYRPAIQPAWLKHDRQVLRFFSYFQEPVVERPEECARVRNCTIAYYLEDGTMQITEPKVENSGIWPQGPFVKRHRIAKPDGNFFGPQDLQLGTTVTVYGRSFRILSCDEFTRWFYGESQWELGEPEAAPLDKFFETQVWKQQTAQHLVGFPADVMESKEYTELKLGGSRKNNKLRQFMENDRKVLRYYAYWDDPTRYGARQYFTVHYYLADDTIEILNAYARNSGRDPYPVFYTRGPLNKKNVATHTPAMLVDKGEPVTPRDIVVGQTFPVHGRDFFVYDADDATKSFYADYLHLECEPAKVPDEPRQHLVLRPPPHTGFGSEDDSLASCRSLVPKPPRKDLAKLMSNSARILRYECRCDNGLPEDAHRKFIVGFFLADDTIAVWELRQRNSGQVEGKFAERGLKTNPSTGRPFLVSDLFVGARVSISAMRFAVTRADEFTLKYMEKEPDTWPQSDFAYIASKLQNFACPEGVTSLGPESFRAAAQEQLGVVLVDQELVTILRTLGEGAAINMATLREALDAPPAAASPSHNRSTEPVGLA